jgi:hypothetical protein
MRTTVKIKKCAFAAKGVSASNLVWDFDESYDYLTCDGILWAVACQIKLVTPKKVVYIYSENKVDRLIEDDQEIDRLENIEQWRFSMFGSDFYEFSWALKDQAIEENRNEYSDWNDQNENCFYDLCRLVKAD